MIEQLTGLIIISWAINFKPNIMIGSIMRFLAKIGHLCDARKPEDTPCLHHQVFSGGNLTGPKVCLWLPTRISLTSSMQINIKESSVFNSVHGMGCLGEERGGEGGGMCPHDSYTYAWRSALYRIG